MTLSYYVIGHFSTLVNRTSKEDGLYINLFSATFICSTGVHI